MPYEPGNRYKVENREGIRYEAAFGEPLPNFVPPYRIPPPFDYLLNWRDRPPNRPIAIRLRDATRNADYVYIPEKHNSSIEFYDDGDVKVRYAHGYFQGIGLIEFDGDPNATIFTGGASHCVAVGLCCRGVRPNGGYEFLWASLMHLSGGDVSSVIDDDWQSLKDYIEDNGTNQQNLFAAVSSPNGEHISPVWDRLQWLQVPEENASFYLPGPYGATFGINGYGEWGEISDA